MITLTEAAVLADCSRKSLERRVERGSLAVTHDGVGRRAVRLGDLMRCGLVGVVAAGAGGRSESRRDADAEAGAEAMRAALAATDTALRRMRDEVAALRERVRDAETRAAMAEDDLTHILLARPQAGRGRRGGDGRPRLRVT